MKLSDIVSHLQLPIFAEVPLLIFLGVFLGVVAHIWRRPEAFGEQGALPLRDDVSPRKHR